MNPELSVVQAEIRSLSLAGVNMDCTMKAYNPNLSSLPATRIVYKLEKVSDGTVLSEGVANKEFTIPGGGTIDVVVPMTFKYSGIGAAGRSLLSRGATKILVSGDITFAAPMVPGGSVVVRYQGEVDIVIEEDI